jgi:hypothetical protein
MRIRVLVAGRALVATLVVGSLALAQSRTRPVKPANKPKPSTAATAETRGDEKAQAAPAIGTGAPPGASNDAGSAVAAPAAEGTETKRLSPLNPAPNEFSDAGAPAPSVDYERLLADIASLRARVAAVSDTLFHSRISLSLQTRGDHGRIAALNVLLDDGVVWTSPASFRADDPTTIYDHAVAPGHHSVTVDIERRDDRNDNFRSSQRSRLVVEVPADQNLSVQVKLSDESDMGGEFPNAKSGQYELFVSARAKAQPIAR